MWAALMGAMLGRLLAGLAIFTLAGGVAGCAASTDGEEAAGADSALTAFEPPPAYAEGKLLSDLTPEVVTKLRAIHARSQGEDRSFIKVGDSITVSTSFLHCFATTPVTATEDASTLEETRRFFVPPKGADRRAATSASETPEAQAPPNPWTRVTKAARVGAHTNEALAGNPSPLAKEIADMRPAFAVVMLGTNDVFEGTQPTYERNLSRLVTAIADQGIVPILSTIPPMRDAARNVVIVKMNRIARKIAAETEIPLMDYHLAVVGLPKHGLSNDGVHPFAASSGACDFRAPAMVAGYNQRNLLALKALDRTRRAVLDLDLDGEGASPDGPVKATEGEAGEASAESKLDPDTKP